MIIPEKCALSMPSPASPLRTRQSHIFMKPGSLPPGSSSAARSCAAAAVAEKGALLGAQATGIAEEAGARLR